MFVANLTVDQFRKLFGEDITLATKQCAQQFIASKATLTHPLAKFTFQLTAFDGNVFTIKTDYEEFFDWCMDAVATAN